LRSTGLKPLSETATGFATLLPNVRLSPYLPSIQRRLAIPELPGEANRQAILFEHYHSETVKIVGERRATKSDSLEKESSKEIYCGVACGICGLSPAESGAISCLTSHILNAAALAQRPMSRWVCSKRIAR